MIKFGAGKYVPRVGNCDTTNNPHEQKPWGKGRNYQWGEADSDNKGGKACALTWTGQCGGGSCHALAAAYFRSQKGRREPCAPRVRMLRHSNIKVGRGTRLFVWTWTVFQN
jgi:hypothetical protein